MKFRGVGNAVAAAVFSAVAAAASAQSAKSAYVPVRGPKNVFDPIVDVADGVDEARLVDATNVFHVAYVEDFEIDGDFTKPVWRRADPVAPFLPMAGRGMSAEAKAQTATEVRLLYSATSLYIGASFAQPMDRILVRYDQDDLGIYNDDCLEALLLVPHGRGEDLLHFAVNALGSCFDQKNARPSWNAKGREVRARRLKDRWTLEMRLPFEGLGMDRPVGGDFVGARFCRHVSDPSVRVSAPQMEKAGNNGRHSMAKLLFTQPEGAAAEESLIYRKKTTAERAALRLLAAKRRVAAQEAVSKLFADPLHPAFNAAVQAVHQMKDGLERFERGEIANDEFLALDAGFRKFAGENAYLVWTASPWERGDPMRIPPANAVGVPHLFFEQAGNEREQICLEFTGLLCGLRLDLRIVPQSVDDPGNGCFVSNDSFEIYEEPFVNYEKELITAPLVEKAGNTITLTPGRTTRVWVVFNSRGVKPGRYRTKILLKPAWDVDYAEKAIDVEMKVWNFALPETRDWPLRSFFWGPETFLNDETHTLRLMHDHHVTHGWTKGLLYWMPLARNGSIGKRDHDVFDRELAETANEEFFRTAKALGMRFVFGWHTPHSLEWFKIMEKRLLGMGFGYDDFIFKTLISDEFTKAQIPTRAERRAELFPSVSNMWFQAVYLSTPPPTGATMDDIEAAGLPEFYKMWAVIEYIFKDKDRGEDVVRRLREKGCQVWSYNCERYMQTKDILDYYRFWLWKCHMRGLDGAAMWTSGSRSGDDGWDSRDGYDDGILWCGNGKRQYPTKRFEAFREGLEDVAYMDRLEKEIERSAEAKALLDAREDVINAHSQDALDAWRLAVGRLIDAIVAPSK